MTASNKVMLITGAAKRIGAYLAQAAHSDGYKIVLHYRTSAKQTQVLAKQLNAIRANSCLTVQADFSKNNDFADLVKAIELKFKRLDVLINNASEFFQTDFATFNLENYNTLFDSNLKGALFLSQACLPLLQKSQGNIINMVDIHADKPLKNYSVYCMAKAANKMMVKALAKELAPTIRVNGIAPGFIENPIDNNFQPKIINRIALKRQGTKHNIYQTVQFILKNDYLTGQIIKVDGGRSLNM
ncbi:MAG TPA: pteridine reductase [Oceanospirillales bacterium]|nr:pteridine reductase [Oceanospirillales bacterium]